MTTHPPTSQTDEREIQAVHETWIAAVNAGELDRLLAMVTDDVVFVSPGQEPARRESFSAVYAAALRQFQFHCTSELEEVVVAGDIAYTRARDTLSIAPRSGGVETRLAGHRLTIYRKQPDSRWLLARDAHTLAPGDRPS